MPIKRTGLRAKRIANAVAKREATIRRTAERILPWIQETVKGRVRVADTYRQFPNISRQTLESALRLLQEEGKIHYVRHRISTTEARRKKLRDFLKNSKQPKTIADILKSLGEEYAGFKNPKTIVRSDIRLLEKELREKVVGNIDIIALRIGREIERNPKITNAGLAALLKVGKRTVEMALTLVPEEIKRKRIIRSYSTEQRCAQNAIIFRGIRRGYSTRNILIEINRNPTLRMTRNTLRERIKSITGRTVPEIEQQNRIITNIIQDMSVSELKYILRERTVPEHYLKQIKESLAKANLDLDKKEITERVLGIGSRFIY